jgi:hypothetical protein
MMFANIRTSQADALIFLNEPYRKSAVEPSGHGPLHGPLLSQVPGHHHDKDDDDNDDQGDEDAA